MKKWWGASAIIIWAIPITLWAMYSLSHRLDGSDWVQTTLLGLALVATALAAVVDAVTFGDRW